MSQVGSRGSHVATGSSSLLARRAGALALGLLLVAQAAPVRADEPDPATIEAGNAYATDRVIVQWREAVTPSIAAHAYGLVAAKTLGRGTSVPVVVATQGRTVPQVLAELRADPNVLYAEPDYVIQLEDAPGVAVNDSLTASQYSLDRMHVREAWALSTGDAKPIAVLDTGVQYSHPDLAGRLLQGWDFVNGDADASDDNGHGTWVAGIIAANANNGIGVAGVTWSNPILPVKVMSASGTGYTSNLVLGLRWAADHGAGVINMSIGGFPASASVADAVDYAWNKGVVLVAAAGNNGKLESHYPASFPHVISASATQADDEFTKWSNYSPNVDVSAPGASVLTTNCQKLRTSSCAYSGDYITISGTSFASPNTAAVVALIRAKNPTWTPQQVVDRLLATVDDLGFPGFDVRYGHGRVNAFRALGGSVAAAAVPARDSMEVNDSLGSPVSLALGVTRSPTIYPAGDVDHYRVRVPRAGRLDVRVTPVVDSVRVVKSALPVDVVVELLTTSGTRLKLVDHTDPAVTEVASLPVSGAQTIIVRVTNWYPNGSTTPYTIRANYVDTAPPTILARTPSGGSTEVNRFFGPTVTFDEAVAGVGATSLTLRDTVSGDLVPATVTYDAGAHAARLRPAVQLGARRTYQVAVGSGVKDAAGNAFVATSWTFTTGLFGFSDIIGSPFENDISWLAVSGVTGGCGSDHYCPEAPVTREQMASFLARALDLPATAEDFFTDDGGSPHQGDINRLAAAGITGGCAEDRFCPGASVTREQMASFLARALELAPATADFFADDSASPHQADINSLAEAGISGGCAPGKFCPGGPVTRGQMAAFLRRALAD
jgi:subtilisin family serine protease